MLSRLLPILALVITTHVFAAPQKAGWLRELFTIGKMIQEVDNAAIKCSNADCTHQYSCEQLFGIIWADMQRHDVNKLKKAVQLNNHDDIVETMATIAQDQLINCPVCKAFVGWDVVATDAMPQGGVEKANVSNIKDILTSALHASSIGKTLNGKLKKLRKKAKSRKEYVSVEAEASSDPDERKVLPGYLIKPNMYGNYPDHVVGYRLPQVGRGVLRFTAEIDGPLYVKFYPEENDLRSHYSEYEVVFGLEGNTEVELRRNGDLVACTNYSITNPITLEITFDSTLERIFVEKIETDGSKTVILEYNDLNDESQVQFFAFTGCDAGGRIHNVHSNRVVYPVISSLEEMPCVEEEISIFDGPSCAAFVNLESLVDGKYLGVTQEGYLKSILTEESLGELSNGWFVLLTDGNEMLLVLVDFSEEICGLVIVPPPGEQGEYVLQVIPQDFLPFGIFTAEFDGDIAYIRSLSTDGYVSNPSGGNLTTANAVGSKADNGPLAQFRIHAVPEFFFSPG